MKTHPPMQSNISIKDPILQELAEKIVTSLQQSITIFGYEQVYLCPLSYVHIELIEALHVLQQQERTTLLLCLWHFGENSICRIFVNEYKNAFSLKKQTLMAGIKNTIAKISNNGGLF